MRGMTSWGRVTALTMVLFSAALLASCGDDPVTGLEEGTVTGQVRMVGTSDGVAGGVLDLTGPAVNRQFTTLANGAFLFTGLPFGEFTLVLTPPDGFMMAPGSSANRGVQIATGGTATFNFSVTPGGGS